MWKKTAWLSLLLPLLSGCSLKLIGSAQDRPAVISRVRVVSANPDNRLTIAVKRSLASRDVTISEKAPITLYLSKIDYDHPLPEHFTAGVAFTTTATLSAHYKLTTRSGKIILADSSISASQSLFHNANQVNTSSRDNLFQRTLAQKLANSIYFKLSSEQTITQIRRALEVKHAAKGH